MRNECPRCEPPTPLDLNCHCETHGYIPLLERPPAWGTVCQPNINKEKAK